MNLHQLRSTPDCEARDLEREADAEWHAERRARRLAAFRRQRPALLCDVGELHPDITDWGRRLLEGKALDLLLGGSTGVTKTWSAWEVLERAVAAGYAGRIVVASSAEWWETFGPPPDRANLRRMRKADVLVLDDVGSARVGEWERQCFLLGLLDERSAHGRPTVITFNVKSLKDTLGERIASRLARGVTRVFLDGEDRRRTV
jgi:hypothetical protein